MTYRDAVQFLYSLGNEVQTAKLGLERIQAVLRALGDPQYAARVLHVAGTNGKGSTCAMIDAGLRAAGIRTGLFTSPHLEEITERIQIDGVPVTEAQFATAFQVVHHAAESLTLDSHPTYFETVTAMAFWLFREMKIETAVVEVGLGGRLDSTNVVRPALTVITPVDLDHQTYLGNTIEAIASEKAGILKPGVPLILAKQPPEADAVIRARAAELGVDVTSASQFEVRDLELDARGSSFRLVPIEQKLDDRSVSSWTNQLGTDESVPTPQADLDLDQPGRGQIRLSPIDSSRNLQNDRLVCPLAGEHQVDNAVVAALTLHALGVSPQGIADAHWPGRLEHVAPNPDTILDGAHNPAGARALARYLRRFYSHRPIWMIFGAMSDKAVAEVGQALFPLAQELVFTAPQNARAIPPEALLEMAGRGHTAPNIAKALALVSSRVSADDVIVITGSLYLVGEARALLSRHSPKWA